MPIIGRLMITSIRLPIHIEATRPQNRSGLLVITAEPGWTIFSVDFRSPTGRCASLQREKGLSSFYDGRYVTLAELAPRGLRAIEGWRMPAYGG